MKTNKLENRITYFIVTLGLFLLNIKNLSLLSTIFGIILAILFILLFEKLNIHKFKLTKVILFIISIIFMTFYLNKITYFISDNILREYSTISISLSILFTILILGNKGYHTIIKVILLASYFITFFLILGILFTIPYIEVGNLNIDFLKTNIFFQESLYYCFLLVYTYFLIYPISNTKFKPKDLIINGIYQIFTYLLTISVLGTTLTNLYKYPYITILKKISLIGFIERIEIIFSMNYLFCFYFLLLLSYYQIRNLLEMNLKKDKYLNLLLIFIALIVFFISVAIF